MLSRLFMSRQHSAVALSVLWRILLTNSMHAVFKKDTCLIRHHMYFKCLQHFSFLIFVIFEVTACHASEYILSATNLKFKNTFLFQQLRSSFSKAFSRKKNKSGSMSDCELDMGNSRPNFSAPNSPLLQIHMPNGQGLIKGSHSSSA